MTTLGEVVAVLDALYDPRGAAAWDAVGLVTGDPDQPVRRVLFAVDPVQEVIDEAVGWQADLLVAHHPLLLRPVHSVAATHPKGRAVTALVRAGVALHVAHTNADVADPGVSDALAAAVGVVEDLRPLRPEPAAPSEKLVVFVPIEAVDRVVDAVAEAGAGRIGDYDRCAWSTEGTGTFTARPGAQPSVGEAGRREHVAEARVELVLPRSARDAVVAALRGAHPYEEPAFDLVPLAPLPGRRGTGRVGRLAEPTTLAGFVETVSRALPRTASGVRAAGDPDGAVRTVAVCGGSGDDLFDEVRASGADAFLTADLRHHPASEAVAHRRPALVDCAHWATEWPWLRDAAERVRRGLGNEADTVETRVSEIVTDPWTFSRSTS